MEGLKFDVNGLIPVVVQDTETGEVLMVAWMNDQALSLTRRTGEAHFWSRSRQALWRKGETSGNVLRIIEVRVDCDADTLLLRVRPSGPVCHTGQRSCFYRKLEEFEFDSHTAQTLLAEHGEEYSFRERQ